MLCMECMLQMVMDKSELPSHFVTDLHILLGLEFLSLFALFSPNNAQSFPR